MKITKKINNNVALAQDAKGRELIVFGKGGGFPATPYELTDLSRVQRTFYDVDEKYFDLLRDVPQQVFLAADDIAETAREELGCPLNPNLTYVLADHLNFAIERTRAEMDDIVAEATYLNETVYDTEDDEDQETSKATDAAEPVEPAPAEA